MFTNAKEGDLYLTQDGRIAKFIRHWVNNHKILLSGNEYILVTNGGQSLHRRNNIVSKFVS